MKNVGTVVGTFGSRNILTPRVHNLAWHFTGKCQSGGADVLIVAHLLSDEANVLAVSVSVKLITSGGLKFDLIWVGVKV